MTTMPPALLSLDQVHKSFGDLDVVKGISLSIQAGECVGIIGPNGAGKTTTIRLCLGLVTPSSGTITVFGLQLPEQAHAARQRMGVVPQFDSLDPDFTVRENLLVYGRYFGMSDASITARIPELLQLARLEHKADATLGSLSGGMKRRLSLARSLVNNPDLIVLDEPTTGLDPQARHLMWDQLKSLMKKGRAILLTTHFMDEAERLCDRLLLVDHGRVIAQGSPRELVRQHLESMVVEIYGDELDEVALQTLTDTLRPLAQRTERSGETLFCYTDDTSALLARMNRYQTEAQKSGEGIRVLARPSNLEDLFLKLTGRQIREDGPPKKEIA